MTTIVAIQGDGFTVVGADTRITSFDSNGSAYQYTNLGNGMSKIATRGKYLLGAAGDVRAINILHHVFQPPPVAPTLKGKKLDAFITGKLIPTMRQCFDAQGYSAPEHGTDRTHRAEQDSTIVVAINGVAYFIENDYSWTSESNGFYACGSGSDYALGALYCLASSKTLSAHQAKQAIIKSLAAAAKFDPGTGGPYHTFIQQSQGAK